MKKRFILFAVLLILLLAVFMLIKAPLTGSYYRKGLANFQKKNYVAAEKDFSRALLFNHKSVETNINLVKTLFLLDKIEACKKNIDRLVNIAPANPETYALQGEYKVRTKEYLTAVELLNKAISIDSTLSYAFYYRAIAKANQNDLNSAAFDYLKAQQLDKANLEALNKSTELFISLENYKGAIENYNKILKLDTVNVIAYLQRANFKMKIEDYAGAIEDYDKTIKLSPSCSEAIYNRGISKARISNFKDAVQDFEEALNRKYKAPGAMYNLGLSYLNLKQPDEAEKYLLACTKENSRDINDGNVLQLLGTLELMKNNNGQAIKYFTKSLQIDSSNRETYFNRGLAFGYLKDYQKAFDDLNKCIQMGYHSADVYFARGVQYINLQNFKSGCEDFKKAFDLGYPQAKDMINIYCKQ